MAERKRIGLREVRALGAESRDMGCGGVWLRCAAAEERRGGIRAVIPHSGGPHAALHHRPARCALDP